MELTRMSLTDFPECKIDPRHLHVAILSVSAFIPIAQPLLSHLFGDDSEVEKHVDVYLRLMAKMLADNIEGAASPQKSVKRARKR